jgi:aminopeptidase YwaD
MEKQPMLGKERSYNLARSCLEMTKALIERHRYRVAGTSECRQTAHEIAEVLQKGCDSIQEETFTLHPKALWYLGKAMATIYLVSTIFVTLGSYFVYIGSFLCLLGFVYGLSQYVFYGRLFDPLFKSADGCNVVGTLEPKAAVEQQVVLVGHHDSPYIFNFLERFQGIAFIRFLLGMVSYIWLCVYSVLLSIQQLSSIELQSAKGFPLWITTVGLLFALQLFFMMSNSPSPGAGDNLNSTSMSTVIARYFKEERKGDAPLQNTRLIILSTDGEEIGQRGAIEYVRRHYSELHTTITYVFNMDSVYYHKHMTVLTRDRNYTCKLSKAMVTDICEVATENGLHLKRMPIPFGGGGTDAAAFAVAGIEATAIIAQPTGLISNEHLYHTSRDVVEQIDVAAVQAIMKLAIGYIRKVDSKAREQAI